ncbi:MAG TPA: DUF1614 domain-containing protein [Methanoregula sp.]|nr:DUF1614 domain-containing protein [Methanoregula sp.]
MSNGIRFFSAGPRSVFIIIILVGLVIILIPLLILGMIGAAFTRLGFSWISALIIVLLMLFGSFVNIPVYRIRRDTIRVSQDNSPDFGVCVPFVSDQVWDTMLSLNFGGAVIPVCISLYMVYQAIQVTGMPLVLTICSDMIIVVVITFLVTRFVNGVGIQVPLFIPGLTALLAGLLLAGEAGLVAAVTAFVSGTSGVLIGGNILHLFRIKDLEISDVSIGGAGTFGAIFICCILPALIS